MTSAAQVFELPVRRPFDWESLLAFFRARATPGVETVGADGVYGRTFDGSGRQLSVAVGYDARNSVLRVEHSGSAENEKDLAARIARQFRTAIHTTPIEAFLRKDRWLGRLVERQPGLRVPGGWSDFEIALRAVLGQQVSVPAATTLMGRLMRASATWSGASCIFPSPEQVLQADIRALGMPGKRLEAVRSVAEFFRDRKQGSPLSMDELLAVRGVGRWTAGYILMRAHDGAGASGHDHWPEGDLILRKALSPGKELLPHPQLAGRFERWRPWRSYATLHIWKGCGSTMTTRRGSGQKSNIAADGIFLPNQV